jgi:anti-sigma regulatory factor (Ser/Thr protein kinase)
VGVSDTPAGRSLEDHRQAPARDRWVAVFRGGARAPAQARHAIAERLNGELPASRRQDVVLLAGELVANSVVHANGDASREILVELVVAPDIIHVAVTDEGSPSVPTVRPRSATLESGRGLLLVEHLSDRWGITREGTSRTRVWFEMVRGDQAPT